MFGGEVWLWASWPAFIGVGLLALHAGWLVGVWVTTYFGRKALALGVKGAYPVPHASGRS